MTNELLVVVGARPNFVKVAPVIHALDDLGAMPLRVLNTGQHYDEKLAGSFLERLRFPPVDHELSVGSGTHAQQTAAVLVGVERVLAEHRYAALLVAGDVNSTMASALAAAKMGVPVIHLESGLRSGDREMPEEINRIVTDQVSDLLLCHSQDGVENLAAEGVPPERIELVGNTMIDSLFSLRPEAGANDALRRLGLSVGGYVLVTLHRPSLVDEPEKLEEVLSVLRRLATRIPVVLPLHPRTSARLGERGPRTLEGLLALGSLDYLDFIALEAAARLVITDSGGVQEETSALGVPCLTYRTTTERPVTVTHGTNRLVGVDPHVLACACEEILDSEKPQTIAPIPLWDGQAGVRAAASIATRLRAWGRDLLTQ